MALLVGCASSRTVGSVDSMSCDELNKLVGSTAKDISAAGIRRGDVESFNPPVWLLGARRTQEALRDRETRRIEELRQTQDQAAAERQRRCR